MNAAATPPAQGNGTTENNRGNQGRGVKSTAKPPFGRISSRQSVMLASIVLAFVLVLAMVSSGISIFMLRDTRGDADALQRRHDRLANDISARAKEAKVHDETLANLGSEKTTKDARDATANSLKAAKEALPKLEAEVKQAETKWEQARAALQAAKPNDPNRTALEEAVTNGDTAHAQKTSAKEKAEKAITDQSDELTKLDEKLDKVRKAARASAPLKLEIDVLLSEKTALEGKLWWANLARTFAMMLVSAYPFLVACCLALVMYGHGDRLAHDLRTRDLELDLASQLRATWESERYRSKRARREFVLYGALFGATSSTVLAYCLPKILVLDFVPKEQQLSGLSLITMTTASATFISFVVSMADLIIRGSRQDTSPRAFGNACRSLILATVTAIIASALLVDRGTIDSPTKALLVGMIIALMGDHIVAALFEGVAMVFGVSSGLDDDLESFRKIEGLDEAERLRLKEQGISTLHALAMASTSYVYFNTRYTYERILDWQDQALFLMLLGEERAEKWRSYYLVRGASKARALATTLRAEAQKGMLPEETFKKLGFESHDAAMAAFALLIEDKEITRIEAWRKCMPEGHLSALEQTIPSR